jgi:AcrR family transcriptional regulator
MLDAAQRLFERDGFAATTVSAIAAEARVSTKTVYLAFDSKSGVLRALWNLRLRGDDGEAPVAARQWYLEALEEPDPERRLRLNARNARAVKTRLGAVMGVVRTAAAVDPDAAALWARIQSEFYANQREIVKSLHRNGALRHGLNMAQATDILADTPREAQLWASRTACSRVRPWLSHRFWRGWQRRSLPVGNRSPAPQQQRPSRIRPARPRGASTDARPACPPPAPAPG